MVTHGTVFLIARSQRSKLVVSDATRVWGLVEKYCSYLWAGPDTNVGRGLQEVRQAATASRRGALLLLNMFLPHPLLEIYL